VVALSDVIRASSGSSNFARGLLCAPNKAEWGQGCSLEAAASKGIDAASSSTDLDLSYQDDVASALTTFPAVNKRGDFSDSCDPIESEIPQQRQVQHPACKSNDDSFISSASAETKFDKGLSTLSNPDPQHFQQLHSTAYAHRGLTPYLSTDPYAAQLLSRHHTFNEGGIISKEQSSSSTCSMDDSKYHHRFFKEASSDSLPCRSLSAHSANYSNTYRNYSNTFPLKLFDLVSTEDETIVGWHSLGTAFQVRDHDQFVNVILPKHFKREHMWLDIAT